MKAIILVTTMAVALNATVAIAQTLSIDDLRSKIDERVSERDSFQALLNDPDPDRSLAALQIMLESGDPALAQIALSQGLVSTSSRVRRATLESFLNGGPSLELTIESGKLKEDQQKNFNYQLGYISATLKPGSAYINYRVGAFNSAKGCWVYANDTRYCMIRLSEQSLSLFLFRKWSRLELNKQGVLHGTINIPKSTLPFEIQIPVVR